MSGEAENNVIGYDWLSYYLSRFNFIAVHLFTIFYWLPFLFNNPFGWWWVYSTLDVSEIKPEGLCTSVIWPNVQLDVLLWLTWWIQHSVMSREFFKRAIGTWGKPIDRPLFGLASCIVLPAWTILYKPITDCQRTDFTDPVIWARPLTFVGVIVLLITFSFILAYFWILPSHVFGTDHYKILKSRPPLQIIVGFPYGIVRHPAAAGFLFFFWAIPSYTTNHLLYAALWTIFIIIGTAFEEAGLNKSTAFGKQYAKYSTQVSAFIPRLGFFTGEQIKL
jgi:methanethiol S-methyltransferase